MKGVKQSASLYKIPLESLNAESTIKRFPKFKIPTNFETLFEPDAGFIAPEKAILLYTELAIKIGAQIHKKEKVVEWTKDGSGITVTTGKNACRCNKLIITAGAWAGKMIPGLSNIIKVTRQFTAWVKPKTWNDFTLNNFPCWMIADDAKPGAYYGFPILPVDTFGEPTGLKLAYHFQGIATDPDQVNRLTMEEDEENLRYVLTKYLPDGFESFLFK